MNRCQPFAINLKLRKVFIEVATICFEKNYLDKDIAFPLLLSRLQKLKGQSFSER
jgi:hypothetical protein